MRRSLPVWGRLAVDRPLPFLCVYRRPGRIRDDATYRLVTSEASYLTCSAARRQREGIGRLAAVVAEIQAAKFGGFLILEVWAGKRNDSSEVVAAGQQPPAFKIHAPRDNGHEALTDTFEEALRRIKLGRQQAAVTTVESSRRWPRGLSPLMPTDEAGRIGCLVYGLEVAPVYLDPASGETYTRVLSDIRRKLSIALRRFFYGYARSSTTADPAHFHVLGRRAVVNAVWEVDGILADVSEAFEFLLQLTPVNGEQAWHQFQRNNFQSMPAFHYRPLLADPVVLKRSLFKAPVERIEDPALALVFRQKLDEIDRQITMLQDRNSSRFLHESIQLFGGVEDDLHALAVELLERIPPRSREGPARGSVNAETFAQRAREEIEFLRSQRSEVKARVEVRPDVTGLLVSRGNLLVSSQSRIPVSRVEALVQHEVGTHVLTYHNGRAQKLRLLSSGFAGYDALQEGLAVLSEYLAGGLSRPRLRLLAGRVLATRSLLEGATFIETFRELHRTYGFASRTAFTVTVRVYRGGGLTKDSVYLHGLKQILNYVGKGGKLEPLFIGKIAIEHIPIIRELTWRGVLSKPPLIPRYMYQPDSLARLERLRRGVQVVNLLEGRRR
ncbi:MAG: tyrosine/phenylalanine carboxypeptidase domain-containing protein [bacterium]